MKHFVVEITFTGTPEQIAAVRPNHRAFLQTGYEKGWLLCSGPTAAGNGGFAVGRAPALEAIQEFFAGDPYLLQGIATHRFVEFAPVLHQAFLAEWVGG